MFEIKNLRFKNILDIPHLKIDREITCIVGSSGCGKTTLLRHLNRLIDCEEGEVLFNGNDIKNTDPVLLRRQIVMLGQTPIIYPGTIEDNLQMGRIFSQNKPLSKEHLLDVLQQVQLDKELNEPCEKLSGGEKQRLCLGRVMLMDADVYLMDEPSSALDKETELFVINQLATYVKKKNAQLIMVTHSFEIAKQYPNAIIEMKQGKSEGYTHG